MNTKYKLTCHSPVHIGTGNSFTRFDSVYDAQSRSWMPIDLDKVVADPHTLAREMEDRNFAWVFWLRKNNVRPAKVALYQLPCAQDPEDTEVREAIKNPYLQPYIPGSSIKGAIRTAVLWHLLELDEGCQNFLERYLVLCTWAKKIHNKLKDRQAFDDANAHREVLQDVLNVKADDLKSYQVLLYELLNVQEQEVPRKRREIERGLQNLGKSGEWLGQAIERKALGKSPNHDLMRAVHVVDAQPVDLSNLRVALTWTYTLQGGQLKEKRESNSEYKIFAECFKHGTEMVLTIRIDEALFGNNNSPFGRKVKKQLNFQDQQVQSIRQLARTCNYFSTGLIDFERKFYEDYGLEHLQGHCDYLLDVQESLPEGAFLLNIGWGGGWNPKTIGVHEFLEENDFQALRSRYNLGRQNSNIFPKTRRVVYVQGVPKFPLGWVSLKPIRE